MAWTTTKRVCKALYFSLQRAEQVSLQTEFIDAGQLTMKDLLFFNQHASEDLRRIDATLLASRLDDEFITIYKARYEAGNNKTSAILQMIAVLMERDLTVEMLSGDIDACYKFKDE